MCHVCMWLCLLSDMIRLSLYRTFFLRKSSVCLTSEMDNKIPIYLLQNTLNNIMFYDMMIFDIVLQTGIQDAVMS